MAKKKHQDADVPADPETEPAGDNGQQGEPQRQQPADKAEAVREVLDEGLTSPTQIAARIWEKYGISITPNYVSVIKGQELKSKGKKGKSKKRNQPQRQENSAAPRVPAA